jgi:hypothetical protein
MPKQAQNLTIDNGRAEMISTTGKAGFYSRRDNLRNDCGKATVETVKADERDYDLIRERLTNRMHFLDTPKQYWIQGIGRIYS